MKATYINTSKGHFMKDFSQYEMLHFLFCVFILCFLNLSVDHIDTIILYLMAQCLRVFKLLAGSSFYLEH